MIDDIMKDVSDIALTLVISKVNLMGSNPKEWWICKTRVNLNFS